LFGGTATISDGTSIIFPNVTSGVATANAPAITTNTIYTLTATNIKNVSATATASVTINQDTGFYGTLTVNNLPGVNGGRFLDYQWFVNGSPLNSITRINANGAPSSITINNRLEDINVQLTLNITLEANSSIRGFTFTGATVVTASQFQTIFTANSNNLDDGTIVVNYTITAI
jgi:hypothetical protein